MKTHLLTVALVLLVCTTPMMGQQADAAKLPLVSADIVDGNLRVGIVSKYNSIFSAEALGLSLQEAVKGSGQSMDNARSYFVLMISFPYDHLKEPILLPNGQMRRVYKMPPPLSGHHCEPPSKLPNGPIEWQCLGLETNAKPLVVETTGKIIRNLGTDFEDERPIQLVIVPIQPSH